NFPFLSSNIPSAPAYGVYVSQLIRYARACFHYQDFVERGKLLTSKLLSQDYRKANGHGRDLVRLSATGLSFFTDLLTTREHLITLPVWGSMSVYLQISDLSMLIWIIRFRIYDLGT
ncbi:MAG: hypothetical protein AB2693_16065, partial [Candidatus Thiodiazotropha sp.]